MSRTTMEGDQRAGVEDSHSGNDWSKSLGLIHFVQKDNEVLITSQEDDVTPEFLNSLFDTGRPNLVALAATKLGRFYGKPSNGA
ncbi:hypothetical protein Droror1_Dr00019855 [Drosera rotundifolia]